MTLNFDKNDNGDIIVSVAEGTQTFDFSYIDLIKNLLNKKTPSINFSDKMQDEEKNQISELFTKIIKIAVPDENNSTAPTEQF